MNLKSTFIFVLCSFFFFQLSAQYAVDYSSASNVAQKFYYERASAYRKMNPEHLNVVNHIIIYDESLPLYYVFEMGAGGYVIVSASKRVQPVLGYSFESRFPTDNTAPNFSAWMAHYSAQISYAEANQIMPLQEIGSEWHRLESNDYSHLRDFSKEKSVLPLISSRWNQGKYYNGMCPEDPAGPDGRTYAGCVATAMGQLLYYHRWPETGTGSYSYQHPVYGTISSDFENTVFDWDAMPNSINKPNKAIADLLYNMGVAVDMNYGPNGSGMWNHSAARAMRNYFKYGPETEYIFRDSTTLAWDSIIIANLDQMKPLYYAGWTQNLLDSSGHAFICDGYQGVDYYHFDWGWGGAFNGYFYLHQLTPGGANFNFRQEVIKDVYPDTLNYTYPVQCGGLRVLTEFVGSLEDGSGIRPYAPNADCSWLIAPDLFVSSIKLSFDYFDTESDSDFVRVYAGEDETATLLGAFSGNTLPQDITYNGQKLFVTFKSNDSISGRGFKATYTGNIPTYCTPLSLISTPSDTISDGSGDNKYNYATNCRWRIQPPNAENITIKFLNFDIDENVDFFEIYDMTTTPVSLLDIYTGANMPAEKTYNSGVLMLWFKSNTYNPQMGWKLVYTSSATGIDDVAVRPEIRIYPNPANSNFNIELNVGEIKTISIFSIDGREVFNKEISEMNSCKINIETENWGRGIYMMRLQTSDAVFNERIIVF